MDPPAEGGRSDLSATPSRQLAASRLVTKPERKGAQGKLTPSQSLPPGDTRAVVVTGFLP